MTIVEIDADSGFCGGVIRAISTAESYLSAHGGPLYSLGAIVHNEQELSRLSSLGLLTIDSLDELPQLCAVPSEPCRADVGRVAESASPTRGSGESELASCALQSAESAENSASPTRGSGESELASCALQVAESAENSASPTRGSGESELASCALQAAESAENAAAASSQTPSPLLIRAHGEPPCIYEKVRELGCKLLDCTCPVVLKLQKQIRQADSRLARSGGSIVIYGKEGHPEVLGLVGQVSGNVFVAPDVERLRAVLDSGDLASDRDIELFSQTTMSPQGYEQLADFLSSKMQHAALTVHNTICSQVASRHSKLADFARKHDVILFVAGEASSNGKVLSDLCRRENSRTYFLSSECDLRSEWFRPGDRVGVCGATSTPRWLLEKVAKGVKNLY